MALVAAFCASPEYRVEVQRAAELRPLPRRGPFNAEERLIRGEFPEVESYYQQMPPQELEGSSRDLAPRSRATMPGSSSPGRAGTWLRGRRAPEPLSDGDELR